MQLSKKAERTTRPMMDRTFLIGICDDVPADLERIKEALFKNFESEITNAKASVVCRLFQDGEELYEACKKDVYDLIFLDIEMPDVDGFQLAKRISLVKGKCSLIFVSGHENFVFDSLQYSPLWFVRKGMLERDMRLALQKYMELAGLDMNCRLFKGKGIRALPIGDIVYLESRGHLLFVKKRDGGFFEQYGSLKAFEKELSVHNFLRIHKSFLVNQQYIEEIRKRDVLLTDGTSLEMGRDRRKSLLAAMRRYTGA